MGKNGGKNRFVCSKHEDKLNLVKIGSITIGGMIFEMKMILAKQPGG